MDIKQINYDGTLFYFFKGARNAQRLYGIIRLTYASSIDKTEHDPINGYFILDSVARGAGNFGDNGFIFIEQRIQQSGFACIWFSNYSHWNSILDHIAHFE